MFSALKKLVRNEEDGSPSGMARVPSGIRAMGYNLQRKFAKGVQYNMKVIIKGDRNTGKSSLLQRLQGGKFQEDYIPTSEIEAASIQWNYKATDDVVKVEVWDVVDKGKGKKKKSGLKLANDDDSNESEGQHCLDAEFLDVYKGTNGIIIIYDICKQWTFDYVKQELERMPKHIPALVLANFRDMGDHRTVKNFDLQVLLESLERPKGAAPILYSESSMKNGYGLHYLYNFLNLPFLQLQRDTLIRQLETNKDDIKGTMVELSTLLQSEEYSYEAYSRNQCHKPEEPVSPTVNGFLSDERRSSVGQKINKWIGGAAKPGIIASDASTKPQLPPDPPQVASPTIRATLKPPLESEDSIDSFFSTSQPTLNAPITVPQNNHDSSTDDETITHNPMVATFQEDLDDDARFDVVQPMAEPTNYEMAVVDISSDDDKFCSMDNIGSANSQVVVSAIEDFENEGDTTNANCKVEKQVSNPDSLGIVLDFSDLSFLETKGIPATKPGQQTRSTSEKRVDIAESVKKKKTRPKGEGSSEPRKLRKKQNSDETRSKTARRKREVGDGSTRLKSKCEESTRPNKATKSPTNSGFDDLESFLNDTGSYETL